MPIRIVDYTWRQTPERVTLTLDLHRTSPKKVDVVTTSSYLKVSYLPYMCEIFLCHMIKVDQCSARIQKGSLELCLVKAEPQLWKELGVKLTKEEMEDRRQKAIKDVAEEEKRKTEVRKENSTKRERFAVSQQILADDQVRAERSKVVEREKAKFLELGNPLESNKDQSRRPRLENEVQEPVECTNSQVNNLQAESLCGMDGQKQRGRVNSTCSEEGMEATQEVDYDGDGEDSIHYSSTENLHHADASTRLEKLEMKSRKQKKSSGSRKTAGREKENKKKNVMPVVPPVRSGGTISVTHTPRVFPSPARESTKVQEQQWLEAQKGMTSVQQSTDTNSSQHTEEHFKNKAVTLFSNGDYQGCANACTEGLRINPSSPAFYSNRAAAHLALRNLHHTIKDCSKALELLTPATQENSNSRLLCHIRRGTALVRLSLLSEGLADYQAALQLSPENKALQKDVDRIQSMLMASTDSNEDSGCEAEVDRGAGNCSSP